MKGLMWVGVLLIVAGLAGLTWPVISYTRTEKVVDIGPVEVTADRTRRVPVPPIVGGLAVAAGLILVVSSRRHA